MKTTKAKSNSTAKKSASTVKTSKSRNSSIVKDEPGEDEIRMKAQELYLSRITKGEEGTAADDWHKAENLLKGL